MFAYFLDRDEQFSALPAPAIKGVRRFLASPLTILTSPGPAYSPPAVPALEPKTNAPVNPTTGAPIVPVGNSL
jgi:hypothetical protein